MRSLRPFATVALLALLALPASAAPGKFKSRIGVHLIGRYSAGTRKMVQARLPVLKILDLHGPLLEAARDYKKANPDGVVVLRCYNPVHWGLGDDPEQKGQEYWDNIIWKKLGSLAEADRKLIDYVEATNECDNCPTWGSPEDTQWFTKFSVKFAEACGKAGFKPCLASIPVGNPGGNRQEIQAKILEYAPALRAAKKVKGAWSYHSYTCEYTTDPKVEAFYSLRYRIFYEAFKGPYKDLAEMPLIMTEGGVDRSGNKDTDGWQARGDAEKFQNWLKWYDGEIKKDKYVIGVTLFECGDPGGWKTFDVEPMADWLADYWGK